MPFKSAKQRRAMFAKGGKTAKVARRWAKKYGAKAGGGKTKAQKRKAAKKAGRKGGKKRNKR